MAEGCLISAESASVECSVIGVFQLFLFQFFSFYYYFLVMVTTKMIPVNFFLRRTITYVSSGVFRMCESRGPGVLGDGSPQWGPRQSPGRGSGDEVPQKLTLFC